MAYTHQQGLPVSRTDSAEWSRQLGPGSESIGRAGNVWYTRLTEEIWGRKVSQFTPSIFSHTNTGPSPWASQQADIAGDAHPV